MSPKETVIDPFAPNAINAPANTASINSFHALEFAFGILEYDTFSRISPDVNDLNILVLLILYDYGKTILLKITTS